MQSIHSLPTPTTTATGLKQLPERKERREHIVFLACVNSDATEKRIPMLINHHKILAALLA